jgi:orotidine-5'-phosphate decarboxylase
MPSGITPPSISLPSTYICCLKTHIDILSDFDKDTIVQLESLSQKHNFLIFEGIFFLQTLPDRKFADIGNTVKNQYESGIYKIASWSHITNAHPIPGAGIVTGLAQVGLPLGRGLLLLAEMSSKGALATGEYTEKSLDMARANTDFVIGFIGQTRLETAPEDFIYMTPGVNLVSKGDALGQQYRTPRQVVYEAGLDSIIVGRGIYAGMEREGMVERAREYRDAGWSAYVERCEDK